MFDQSRLEPRSQGDRAGTELNHVLTGRPVMQCGRMSSAHQRDSALAVINDADLKRDEQATRRDLLHHPVEALESTQWRGELLSQEMHPAANCCQDQATGHSMSGDVADHHREPLRVDRHIVEVVTSDLSGRQRDAGDVEPWQLRRGSGQHAELDLSRVVELVAHAGLFARSGVLTPPFRQKAPFELVGHAGRQGSGEERTDRGANEHSRASSPGQRRLLSGPHNEPDRHGEATRKKTKALESLQAQEQQGEGCDESAQRIAEVRVRIDGQRDGDVENDPADQQSAKVALNEGPSAKGNPTDRCQQ
jgi:hypothetical protein